MKNLYLLLLLVACLSASAQTTIFHENMENIDSVFSSGNPGWHANTRLQVSGTQSDSTSIATNDTSFLTTQSFDLTGYTYVLLSFNHICKLSFFDKGMIEVFDGTSWIHLTSLQMIPGQTDSSAFAGLGNVFSEAVNPAWLPGQNISPDNTWWRTVTFDVSLLLANVPNAKVRWSAIDFGTPGSDGRAGWFVDDINIIASPCELQPPSLTQLTPVIQNLVLSTGPYTLNINLTDASGIDTSHVYLVYTINNNPPDTSFMTNTSANIFSGNIPAVSDSDTVCYYFSASDFSPCNNSVRYPSVGCIQFIAQSGYNIPFCDNFDLNNFWTSTILSGTPWNYGAPSTSPPSAHSAPFAHEVGLNIQYAANTEAYLVSPPINFSNTVNASVDFWFYSDCENTWDGTRLEYSINNGTTWNLLGNFGTGINWYNSASITSSSLPGWTGNGVTGTGAPFWVNAKHSLNVLNNQPGVLFRFVFTSDGSVSDNGFAIDDFCISLPVYNDAGVVAVSSAQQNLPPAGSTDSIRVAIKNFGANTIQNVPVYFSINNNAPIGPYIYTDTIQSLQTTPLFTIPGLTYTVPQGTYSICVWTDYATDNIHTNDTSCVNTSSIVVINITDSSSYCNNFENGSEGWQSKINSTGNILTQWELGMPTVGQTNSTHSGNNAWDINLDTVYSNNASTVLITPFFNISTNANPNISFWTNYYVENFWDGVRLEFSNDGIIWNTIGVLADTSGTNWYNTQTITCSSLPGWSNASGGWVFTQFRNLSFLNGQNIQLQFSFCSDGVVTRDGFTLDDFCFGNDTSFSTSLINHFSNSENVSMSVTPNPFSQSALIEFTIPQNDDCIITLNDLTGRVIKKIAAEKFEIGNHKIRLDGNNLKSGLYVLNFVYKQKNFRTKVIIGN